MNSRRRLCLRITKYYSNGEAREDREEQHTWCLDLQPSDVSDAAGHYNARQQGEDVDLGESLGFTIQDVFCRVCGLTAVEYLREGNSLYARY